MYIVTGGAGMIGSVMLRKLNDQGISEILVVDNLNTSEKWKNLRNKSYTDYFHKDNFLDLLETGKLGNKFEGIIHLGASSSTTEPNMDYLMQNNLNYSKRLFLFAKKHDVRFIYASSAATYGLGEIGYDDVDELTPKLSPLNRYGYSKQLFDVWLLKNNYLSSVAGLKFFNVYGPNEYHKGGQASVCFHAYKQYKAEGKIKLFKSYIPEYQDGEQQRDFVYVKDCAEVMSWLLENKKACGIFNVGTGAARTWNSLAESITQSLKQDRSITYIDMPDHIKCHYQYFTQAKMDKLTATGCPVKMRSLEAGISDYINNYLEQDFLIY